MKEIINYYYNLDCLEIEESKNYSTFNSFGNTFYFVFFNRTKEELDDLNLAYCMSIHKAQGSEFSLVIMPFSYKYFMMLRLFLGFCYCLKTIF